MKFRNNEPNSLTKIINFCQKTGIINSLLIIVAVSFLTIGWSSFGNVLNINSIGAIVRVDTDIRINSIRLGEFSTNVISRYEEYNVKRVETSILLPELDSYATFQVDIVNYVQTEYGIAEIAKSNPNLNFEVLNYNVGNKLCDNEDEYKCNLGTTTTLDIKITYDSSVTEAINDYQTMILDFDFEPVIPITYYGITDSSLPSYVLQNATYTATFKELLGEMKVLLGTDLVALNVDDNYTFINNTLTIKNVTSSLTIFDYQALIFTPEKEAYQLSRESKFDMYYYVENKNSYAIPYSIITNCDKFNVISTTITQNANTKTRRYTTVSAISTGAGELLAKVWNPQIDYIVINTYALGEGAEYMKLGDSKDSNSVYLEGPLKKNEIETITFVGNNEVPATALGYWDVSFEINTKQTMAWYYDDNNDGLYDLYIGYSGENEEDPSLSNVVQPKNSNNLFNGLTNLKAINFKDENGRQTFNTKNSTSMENMFKNSSNLTSLDTKSIDTSNVVNFSHMLEYTGIEGTLDLSTWIIRNAHSTYCMFLRSSKIEHIIFGDWDTSKVSNMYSMFGQMSSLVDIDLSWMNTENATNMQSMFEGTSKIETLDLSSFSTAKVQNMSNMFSKMSALKTLNIKSFDTSSVTDMRGMFRNTGLERLDLSHFNTESVKDFRHMFYDSPLTYIDLSSFNTKSATGMSNMFYGTKLGSLDLNSWDVSNVTDMSQMFGETLYLNDLKIDNWKTTKLSNMTAMFLGTGLATLDLSKWETPNLTQISKLLSNTKNMINIKVNTLDVSRVENFYQVFYNMTSIENIDLSGWTTSSATNMARMFYGDTLLKTITFGDNWDVSKVTDMTQMFQGIAVSSLDIGNWNVSSLTNATNMFLGCTNLTALNIENWDVSNVTNMTNMFGSTGIINLNLSNWDVSNVTNMTNMFSGTSLTSIDLSNWNAVKVTSLRGWFSNSKSLQSIKLTNFKTRDLKDMSLAFDSVSVTELDLSSFNTSNLETIAYMARGISNLETVNMNGWDTSKVTTMHQLFHVCPKLKTVDMRTFEFKEGVDIRLLGIGNETTVYVKNENTKNFLLQSYPNAKGITVYSEV